MNKRNSSTVRVVSRQTRSPERERLAEMIEAHSAAVQRLAGIDRAMQELRRRTSAAYREEEQAQRAIAKAKQSAGAELVSELLGGEQKESGLDAAQAQLAKATAGIAAAEAARPELERERKQAELSLRTAGDAVRAAVSAVVGSEMIQAIECELKDAQELQAELIAKRVRLRALHRAGCIAGAIEPAVRNFLFDTHVLPATTGQVEWQDFDNHEAALPIRNAFLKLAADPDAALPI